MIPPEEILSELKTRNIQHEVYSTGMIDFRIGERSFVLYIDSTSIGISEIDDNIGFPLVADEQFFDKESFKRRLLEIIT